MTLNHVGGRLTAAAGWATAGLGLAAAAVAVWTVGFAPAANAVPAVAVAPQDAGVNRFDVVDPAVVPDSQKTVAADRALAYWVPTGNSGSGGGSPKK